MTESAVPKIRFADFEDSWQKLRLGDAGRAISGTGFPERYQGGKIGTPFYKVSDMNVSGNELKMNSAQNYVTDGQIVEMKFPVLSGPAICFAKVGAAVMKNRKRFVDGDFILDNNMMAYSLSSGFWSADFALYRFAQIDLTKLVQVGALPSYNATQVEAIETFVPTAGEQKAIGEFFRELDMALEAGEKKLEKLRQFKQSMLVKMFPQRGSLVPEVRFAGFEDAWKKCVLGDLCSFSKGQGFSKKDLKKDGNPVILYGRLYTNYQFRIDSVDTFADPIDGAKYSLGNEVVIPSSGETAEDIAVASSVRQPGVMLGGDLNVVTPDERLDSDFLALGISHGTVHDELARMAQGKTIVHVNNSDIASLNFAFPPISEQRVIVNFFLEVEELLEAEEEKLEKLRQLKATFLQKMFV